MSYNSKIKRTAAYKNNLRKIGNLCLKVLIITTLLLSISNELLIVNGFIFDDDFIDEESGRKDIVKIREEFSQDEVEKIAIDAERDLLLDEIKDVAFLMTIVFSVVVVIAILAALKTVNSLVIIIGAGAALVAALIIGTMYAAESTMIVELLSTNTKEFWIDKDIDNFDLSKITDLEKVNYIEDQGEIIIELLNFQKRISPDIINNARYYRWNDSKYKREIFMIEFLNDAVAHSFIELFFQPISNHRLRNYRFRYGLFSSNNDDYRRGYAIKEDKFVILVFGTEMHSFYAISKIINYLPERYWLRDDERPTIEVISPVGNVNDNLLKLRISDRESGINPLSLRITNIEKKISPIDNCRRERSLEYHSFMCNFENVLKKGENTIVIIASDYEMNNVDTSVTYNLIN